MSRQDAGGPKITDCLQRWLIAVDLVFAVVLSVELAARLFAEPARKAAFLNFTTLADIVAILSRLLAVFAEILVFLRIVRALRLLRLRPADPRQRRRPLQALQKNPACSR